MAGLIRLCSLVAQMATRYYMSVINGYHLVSFHRMNSTTKERINKLLAKWSVCIVAR